MSDEHLLLRVSEAATVLRISRNKAYELVRQGVLPAVHLGKNIRIPRQALERWIVDQSTPPAGELDPAAVGWPSITPIERSA